MADDQRAFDFAYVDLKTEYYDLGLEYRNETEDRVTVESANATKNMGLP